MQTQPIPEEQKQDQPTQSSPVYHLFSTNIITQNNNKSEQYHSKSRKDSNSFNQNSNIDNEGSQPRFTCVFKNCLKSFARSSRLEIHIKTKHLFQDLHKCDFLGCQKSFAERGNLIVHIRTHTGEKPFQCKDCGKQFSSIGNFKDHERRHSNTKPYQCKLCGIEYYRNYQVKKHLRNKHTGENILKNILKNIQTNQLNKKKDQKYKTKSKSPSKGSLAKNNQNDSRQQENENQILIVDQLDHLTLNHSQNQTKTTLTNNPLIIKIPIPSFSQQVMSQSQDPQFEVNNNQIEFSATNKINDSSFQQNLDFKLRNLINQVVVDKQDNYQNDEPMKSNCDSIHQTSFQCQNSSASEEIKIAQVLNYQNNTKPINDQQMNLKFETKIENFKLIQLDFSSIRQSFPDQDMDEYDYNFFQNLEKQVQNLKNLQYADNNDRKPTKINNFSGFSDQSSDLNFIPIQQQNNQFQIKSKNCENKQYAFQNPQIQRVKTVINVSNQENINLQQGFNPLNQTLGQQPLNLIQNHYTSKGTGNSPSMFLSISTQQDSNAFLNQECETFTQQLSSSMNRPKTSQIFDSSRYASLELVQNELLLGSLSQQQLSGQDYRVFPKENYGSNQMSLNYRGTL
eukprot:403369468